jgi:hypothetical protein
MPDARRLAERSIRNHEQVIDAQAALIDGVPTLQLLQHYASKMNRAHFSEVVEERVNSLRCGFPACTAVLACVTPGKLVLSPVTKEVFETAQPLYCGRACQRAAQELVKMMPETPVVIAADVTPLRESGTQGHRATAAVNSSAPEPEREPEPKAEPETESAPAPAPAPAPSPSGVTEDTNAAAVSAGQLGAQHIGIPQLGRRAASTVPQVSPFLGMYYVLQQWCNASSVRALSGDLPPQDSEPHPFEAQLCDALQSRMKAACTFMELPELGSQEVLWRITHFGSCTHAHSCVHKLWYVKTCGRLPYLTPHCTRRHWCSWWAGLQQFPRLSHLSDRRTMAQYLPRACGGGVGATLPHSCRSG